MSEAVALSRVTVVDLAAYRRARAAEATRAATQMDVQRPAFASHGIVWVPVMMMMTPMGVAMGLPITMPMMMPGHFNAG